MSRNGFIAALASAALILSPLSPAMAGGGGGYGGGMTHMGGGSTPDCPNMGGGHGGYGGHGSTLNIYKPININKNINIFKPVVVNKNIDINKNININKNIIVNKNIVINKVNAFSSAEASAFATAAASASAGAASQTIVYSGSYSIVNYNGGGRGGSVGALSVHAGAACHMQEATVVKALHAVCVTAEGREFPASHMIPDTWIDQSYEGEIARCIPGAHLKITIGEVVQSDQGMAGTYDHGAVLLCGEHEAVRQFKDGLLKCTPAIPVPDCTERTNLRRYGTGDLFFSFRTQVCVTDTKTAAESDADTGGMTLDGGVGDSSGN